MEKIVLLCLLVGTVGLLAEMLPRPRPLDANPQAGAAPLLAGER
jgi:hypothetical protein